MNFSTNNEDLVKKLKLLTNLLEHPQPALAAWHEACQRVWLAVKHLGGEL